METLSNVAQTASNAIFGDGQNQQNHQEPISGVKGNTAQGEPYDAGNMDPPPGANDNKTATDTTNTTTTNNNQPNPSTTKPSSAPGLNDSTKAQADTRHPENPETAPGTSTDKNDVDNSNQDKPDVDGPGPRPLDVVAKEHGGDAGTSDTSVDNVTSGKPHESMGQTIKPLVTSSHTNGSGSGIGDNKSGEQEGLQSESHGKGTGEIYEKSSGLAAEGGDFDVTRPGAGREADRLLEEKGIQKSDKDPKSDGPTAAPSHEEHSSEKKSLKDKIKEKLHKN